MKFTVLIDLASIQGNLGIFIHKTYSCSSDSMVDYVLVLETEMSMQAVNLVYSNGGIIIIVIIAMHVRSGMNFHWID